VFIDNCLDFDLELQAQIIRHISEMEIEDILEVSRLIRLKSETFEPKGDFHGQAF